MNDHSNRDHYYIPYINMIIRSFAKRHHLDDIRGFEYLYQFHAIHYLEQYYDIEHTMPIEDTLDTLQRICQNNGGQIS